MAEQNVTQRLTMVSVAKTEGVEQAAAAVGKLDRAVDQAGKSAAQAERVFDRSLDQVGKSAQRAAGDVDRSAVGIRAGLASVSDYMRRDVPTAANYMRDQMQSSAASYVREVQRMGQSIGQVAVNVETGAREIVRSSVQMADATAKAGAQTTRVHASQVQQIERLQKAYDPLYREQLKVVAAEQQIVAAVSSGALPLERGNELLNLQAARYTKLSQAMGGANDNIRLTSHQTTNLGYQLNDIATMMAMGASPFAIISSQAGQVVQALGDGPQGVSGSLRAIGAGIASFARSVPTAAYAVAGVTAAVGALYFLTRGPSARSAEASVESFEIAVKRLEDAWKGAGAAAEEHYERARRAAASNPVSAMLDIQAEVQKLQADYRATIGSLNTDRSLGQRITGPNYGGWSEERQRIRDLYHELLSGQRTAASFADEMTRIAIDTDVEIATRSLAEGIRRAIAPATELEARIKGITDATAGLSGRGGRVTSNPNESTPFDLRDRFGGGVTVPSGRINPEGIDNIRDGLRDQAEQLTKTTEEANKYGEALASLRQGWSNSVRDLRLQVDMFGQSEGAIAGARFQMEALAEARKLAADNDALFDENGADAQRIRETAGEIGNLTDQLKALGETQAQAKRVADTIADLQFQGSIVGLSDVERDVATTLNRLKLDYGSFDGQRIAGQIRYNKHLEDAEDRLKKQRELYSNIASSLFDMFDTSGADSFFDRVTDGLADVGDQFTNDISDLFQECSE